MSMLIRGKEVILRYPSTSVMKMVRVLSLGDDEDCALSLNVLKGILGKCSKGRA